MHCFTLKFNGPARVLHTPIAISVPSKPDKYQLQCIWDTGASQTVITQNVIDALGLIETGKTIVHTASERDKITSTFEIDLYLSTDLVFRNVTVTLGILGDGIEALLGMDIIGTGDFSITNLNRNTCMSFRYPSQFEVDFANNQTYGIEKNTPVVGSPKIGRNDPCPCGSGKKYKNCHSKNG